jgi:hypothetical protein
MTGTAKLYRDLASQRMAATRLSERFGWYRECCGDEEAYECNMAHVVPQQGE